MRDIVVLGSGGHAKVVVATALDCGRVVRACLDDDSARVGAEILGVEVVGGIDQWEQLADCEFVSGIGSNSVRRQLSLRLSVLWATLIHPTAVVSRSVEVGEGSVVFAGAVVQPDTRIGRHVILNTRSSVDHDGVVGDFAHLAPGVSLSGGVSVGTESLIGVGSCVRPGVTIGEGVTVGAGAAVVSDLEDGGTYVGVPARRIAD